MHLRDSNAAGAETVELLSLGGFFVVVFLHVELKYVKHSLNVLLHSVAMNIG